MFEFAEFPAFLYPYKISSGTFIVFIVCEEYFALIPILSKKKQQKSKQSFQQSSIYSWEILPMAIAK